MTEKIIHAFRAQKFKGELVNIPLYYFRGAWNEDKMTGLDRKLCGMSKKMVAKKDPTTYEPWEAALMEVDGNCDWTAKEALKPLIDWVRRRKRSIFRQKGGKWINAVYVCVGSIYLFYK